MDAKPPMRNFGLESNEFRLHGMSGFSLRQTKKLSQNEAVVRGTGTVILETGLNDLAYPDTDPATLARDLCVLADRKRRQYNVGKVIISQIINRDAAHQPTAGFNDRVQDANREIQNLAQNYPNVFYWKHRGVWNPNTQIFYMNVLHPGVHLNDEGNFTYHRSLHMAVKLFGNW